MKKFNQFLNEAQELATQETDEKFVGFGSNVRKLFGTPTKKEVGTENPKDVMDRAKKAGINVTSETPEDFIKSLKGDDGQYKGFIEFSKQYMDKKIEEIDQIGLFKKIFGESDLAKFKEILKKQEIPQQTGTTAAISKKTPQKSGTATQNQPDNALGAQEEKPAQSQEETKKKQMEQDWANVQQQKQKQKQEGDKALDNYSKQNK